MTHLEFWTEYIKELGAGPGWVVFENGTLVHPEGGDSAEEILSRLNDNLLGMSGAGSPYGDFHVSEVFGGHIVVTYDVCVGPLMSHCHRSELSGPAALESGLPHGHQRKVDIETGSQSGVLCRHRRNIDAANRVRLGVYSK